MTEQALSKKSHFIMEWNVVEKKSKRYRVREATADEHSPPVFVAPAVSMSHSEVQNLIAKGPVFVDRGGLPPHHARSVGQDDIVSIDPSTERESTALEDLERPLGRSLA